MALEEIFVNGATRFMKKLVSVAAKRIGRAGSVDKDLQKLKDTLEMIAAVTFDAEKKQVKDKVVLLWLRRLQDVAYDADDLLDEISYKAMCQSQGNANSDEVTVLSTIKFGLKMADRIKIINQELAEIAKHKVMFQLELSVDDDQNVEQLDRMTHSFVDDSKSVGREEDICHVVQMLLMTNPSSSSSSSDNFSPQENISVISIVGMGGLGKTTLAQLVYKDNSIERSFEPRAWVCISDKFDIFLILKNILESITKAKCEVSSVDVLVRKVHEEISGKKYLLVLDDLWNEDAEDWQKLKGYLCGGAQGSRILVTTRKESVARVVRGTIPPYNLTNLSEQECWVIIKTRAFSPGGAVETSAMSKIGEEIARKCAGLPLAANFLGNLMRSKRSESDWLGIRDNDVFNTPENTNKIILILKLSYDNLPSHLKKCFSYCSLFPKDYEFERETLIQLWMAEGFIYPSTGGNPKSPEDIGNNYFLSLFFSSFFQHVKIDYDVLKYMGGNERFKMHDLVHDLALSVIGRHEAMIPETNEMKKDVSRSRRIQLIKGEGESSTFSDVLKNAEKLRTIIFEEEGSFYPSALSNKRLRVIHRLGSNMLEITSSSFKFKHMRYLDLSRSTIEDVHAVASIHQLYNLQTLNLRQCQNVQIILNGIGSLFNLRHLNLFHSDAISLPDSIRKLTNLKTLDISSCRNFTALPANIGALQNLSSLSIRMTPISELPHSVSLLYNLRHLNLDSSEVKILPDSISRLTNLQTLNIGSTSITELPTNIGCLQNLSSLDMSHTEITELPDSICLLHNLKKLEFKTLTALPHNFGDLTQLRSLDLKFSDEITELPESLTRNLCKLEMVHLGDECKFPTDISNWTELRQLSRETMKSGLIMPRGVDKLNRLEVLAPYVVRKEEEPCSCNSSFSSIHELAHLNSLRCLWIRNLARVRGGKIDAEKAKLKDKKNIQELKLFWDLKGGEEGDELAALVLEGLQPHPNLEILGIGGFPCLKLPKWVEDSSSCLPNLVELTFHRNENCRNLGTLGQLPCLKILEILGMTSVICLGREDFYYQQEEGNRGGSAATTSFPLLTKLKIAWMENLEEWVVPSPPHDSFPCLKELDIISCRNLVCIPDLRLWATSLRELQIIGCEQLVSIIPYDLEESLTLLEELNIETY